MHRLSRGILITIEGIDGCGKSTLIQTLKSLVCHLPIIFTKEPGDTDLGSAIKSAVKQQKKPLDDKAEFLLYAADRAQHMSEIVKPALLQKKIVICDRMADSSVVYQGYVRGLDITTIEHVNAWAMDNITPDLTFFIALNPKITLQRIQERKQAANKSFWCSDPDIQNMQRATDGYQCLFAQRKNIITLDGTKKTIMLAQETATGIDNWLKNNFLYE